MKRNEAPNSQQQSITIEFRQALEKGLGGAAILLQKDPHDKDLNAQLLRACINNLVYDPQCEASRIPYLRELIRITGCEGAYRTALEKHLLAVTRDDPTPDVEQVCGILALLAVSDSVSHTVLRDFVLTTEDRTLAVVGASELIRLQGLDGLLACTRRFGLEIAEDPWLISKMTHALDERDGAQAAGAALLVARDGDAALDHLLCLAEAPMSYTEKPAMVLDYTLLKDEVERGDRQYFRNDWIKQASQADIERVAEDLIAETKTNNVKLKAYLSVFMWHDFPGDPTHLFPLLGNASIAVAATNVLARISNPAIRSLAHRLIAEGQFVTGTRLLRSSYGEGDVALLRTLLNQVASDEYAYHSIGCSALNVIKRMDGKTDEARETLLNLYENGPCSHCRKEAVTQLATWDCIPVWMAIEGRYDAEPDIAGRFRALTLRDQ